MKNVSDYMFKTLLFALLMALQNCSVPKSVQEKPNILIIMTDQQSADAMSCVMGTEFIHTPNMDDLANSGMRFTQAYSPAPLCMPMRTSLFTGRYPHETGVLTNSNEHAIDTSRFFILGKIFKDAGYETAYFGKWHIAFDVKQKEFHGFDTFLPEGELNPQPVSDFLKQKHNRPFFAVASFLGPHEICQWSRRQDLPGASLDEPSFEELPPIKENFYPPKNETDIMNYMRKSYQAHRLFPVGNYSEIEWRRLLWGYYRLVERVDSHIGIVLDALRMSGHEDNTLVVFMSDHGDCAGSHHWNQKTVFYDESSRVPLIIKLDGQTTKGVSDVLVNLGIDILPTLCEFANIEIPNNLPGKSLKNPASDKTPPQDREFIVSENHMVQNMQVDGKLLQPQGRMVRSAHYKYILYSEGDLRESLFNMEEDPGEMINQAGNPSFEKILNQHRAYLQQHANQSKDSMAIKMLRFQHLKNK